MIEKKLKSTVDNGALALEDLLPSAGAVIANENAQDGQKAQKTEEVAQATSHLQDHFSASIITTVTPIAEPETPEHQSALSNRVDKVKDFFPGDIINIAVINGLQYIFQVVTYEDKKPVLICLEYTKTNQHVPWKNSFFLVEQALIQNHPWKLRKFVTKNLVTIPKVYQISLERTMSVPPERLETLVKLKQRIHEDERASKEKTKKPGILKKPTSAPSELKSPEPKMPESKNTSKTIQGVTKRLIRILKKHA